MHSFWNRIVKSSTHWLWTGPTNKKGYGLASNMYPERRVHRLAYHLTFGKIPKGMQVCHKCDTPSCINPDHLFLGTAKENTQDMINKGRAKFFQRNKLSLLQVKKIKKSVLTQGVLAEQFKVHQSTISRIKQEKTWRNYEFS